MAGQNSGVDFAEISFFDLDRLFSASARALRQKLKRKRRRVKGANDGSSQSRSRTPVRRFFGRASRLAPFGGFTGKVEKVERTIIAATIPPNSDEKSLHAHFSQCGTVTDVQILRTRQDVPTGIVVVEFAEDEAVARACNLPPPLSEYLGQPLQVKRADAQVSNASAAPKRMMTRQQFTQQVLSGLKSGQDSAAGPNMRKLHIKNLRPVVTEDDMRGIFDHFGGVEKFEMGTQECWITFNRTSDAQDAMSSMQGFDLVGQQLQISLESAFVPPIVPVAPSPSVLAAAAASSPTPGASGASAAQQQQPPQMIPPPMMAPPPSDPPAASERLNLAADSDFGATGTGESSAANRLDVMQKLMASHPLA
mmetsp:Transcript_35349/g.53142  ORF Transcript_35349/g.53142 Transcript_35349/m.53142 type:complete len:365 (+) Transcript_35349:44-1138(+)|eukprot:CAMPEP_0206466374 /NCGR_PEP_ID=MMETSP0324_2-20121206/28417_1 /ASSEMBLY_ACC=CAM_ASM_000836 /TAXON_ID=2866 /ORGANISM="Crypthecodinium cohnii, Strain Seligo" /LENGTH=364 /DNA_ID=CAMNT_0053939471 /DNA_START=59 /DNA_END=1153 /DNA_ORIENTATION=+